MFQELFTIMTGQAAVFEGLQSGGKKEKHNPQGEARAQIHSVRRGAA
jgi:hypothetical protein